MVWPQQLTRAGTSFYLLGGQPKCQLIVPAATGASPGSRMPHTLRTHRGDTHLSEAAAEDCRLRVIMGGNQGPATGFRKYISLLNL